MFITLCHGAFIVWPLNGGMIVSPEISATAITSCQLCQFPPLSTPHSSTHPKPLLLLLSVLAIQAKKKRKNPKGRKGKGGDGDAAAAAGNVGMTSSRSGDVGPSANSGRQFR